jgi:hypothetical protein
MTMGTLNERLSRLLNKRITILGFGLSVEKLLLWLLEILQILSYVAIGLLIVGVILLIVWPFILAAFWQRIIQAMGTLWLRAIATAILFVMSILLYVARRYIRPVYGLAEIILGVAACWVGLSPNSSNTFSATLSLIGGIYIIVRGIDNYNKGD